MACSALREGGIRQFWRSQASAIDPHLKKQPPSSDSCDSRLFGRRGGASNGLPIDLIEKPKRKSRLLLGSGGLVNRAQHVNGMLEQLCSFVVDRFCHQKWL